MKKISFSIIKFLNVVLIIAPFVAAWIMYYEPKTYTVNSKQVSVLAIALYIICFYYFSSRLDGFKVSINRISELALSQIIATGVTDAITVIGIWMLSVHFPNPLPLLGCCAVQCVIAVVCCFFSHIIFFKTHPPRKAIVVYDVRQGMEELISSYGLSKRYQIMASYPVEDVIGASVSESQEKLASKFKNGIEDVFICGVHTYDRNIILKYCIHNNIRALIIPRMSDMIMASAEQMHMVHLPMMRVSRYNPPKEFLFFKRTFDIVASGLGLILASPIMAIVALAVKSDGGPALYKQTRLTKNGKEFKILKFRSMRVDAEKFSGAVWSAGEKDPRITKVGRFIRACRLDELPQLWNILVGEMSIVGPRPERPELAKKFEEEIPEFALRLQCKAGLTGYAQVYGKYNTNPYDKALMDLMYIASPSLLKDFTIILETIKTIFNKESTEGVGDAEAELKYEVRDKNIKE